MNKARRALECASYYMNKPLNIINSAYKSTSYSCITLLIPCFGHISFKWTISEFIYNDFRTYEKVLSISKDKQDIHLWDHIPYTLEQKICAPFYYSLKYKQMTYPEYFNRKFITIHIVI